MCSILNVQCSKIDFFTMSPRGILFFHSVAFDLYSSNITWKVLKKCSKRSILNIQMSSGAEMGHFHSTLLISHLEGWFFFHSAGLGEQWPNLTPKALSRCSGRSYGTPGVPKPNFLNTAPTAMRFGSFDRLLWVMTENDILGCSGRSKWNTWCSETQLS